MVFGNKQKFSIRCHIIWQWLISIVLVSKINWSNNREDKIRQSFSYTKVKFHCPNDVENLNLIIETFQKETYGVDEKTSENDNCNIFGKNTKFDKLFVMDNVSVLADKLNDFSNFLTFSQQFGYICLYIFNIIYLTKSIW